MVIFNGVWFQARYNYYVVLLQNFILILIFLLHRGAVIVANKLRRILVGYRIYLVGIYITLVLSGIQFKHCACD